MNINLYLEDKRRIVETGLQALMLKADGPFSRHLEAMRYSLFAGGKRIRPILCLAAGEAIDNRAEVVERLLPIACALEFIHTYSLIHDDLPAMDNDTLRRGKPTNHILYGEAEAILAGDGLLTLAFQLLSRSGEHLIPAERRLQIIEIIATGAGPLGMVGGQALDIKSEKTEIDLVRLQTIHRAKTGALITSSLLAGALAAGATSDELTTLTQYGEKIGLAFQIVDDILNVTSTTEELGKAAGSDANRGKATYPALFGLAATRRKAEEAASDAVAALAAFDDKAEPLRHLAAYLTTRSK